ncbi:MAG TPA: amidohydrolase family protein [Candidatus Acidoferrales bacterium]|nr:amidohydrolase family protein [Candidatus Acidoferrales bacterium]
MKRLYFVLLIAMVLPGPASAQEVAPDTILFDGKIFTSDPADLYVQALAIRGERIVARGDSTTIKVLAGPRTKQIDLGGRTVIPGINNADQHIEVHPAGTVFLDLNTEDPSWNQLKQAIVEAAAGSPKGIFIYANIGPIIFHDPSIARDALDRLAPDHPVILFTTTRHAAILNSAALAKVGIVESQRDPMGGRYERSADGKLTGVLREYAVLQLERTLGQMPSDPEALSELREFFSKATKLGITTVQDTSDGIEPRRAVKLFEEARTPIRIRVTSMPMTMPAGRDTEEGLWIPLHPSSLITVNGRSWMVDGVPLENTLTPREVPSMPVEQSPDDAFRHLRLIFSKREMEAMLREALANNDPALFHISGYPGTAAILDLMQATGGEQTWASKRVRFENGDGLFPDLVPRAKEMGIIVIQSPTQFDVGLLFGPTPLKFHEAQGSRSLLAGEIPVALGSEGPMNPYLNIMMACLDPSNPPEAITREQAVVAYTLTSAYAEFQEKEKGSLEPGKLADLAVLSQDIFTVPFSDLPKTESVLTLVGGKIIYDAQVVGAK